MRTWKTVTGKCAAFMFCFVLGAMFLSACSQEVTSVTPPLPTPTLTGTPVPSIEIVEITGQVIQEGEFFTPVALSDVIHDTNYSPEDIQWEVEGTPNLKAFIYQGNELRVIPKNDSWFGNEIVVVKACNPDELCDEKELEYAVNQVNDEPTINVEDQVIQFGEEFTELNLSELSGDEDLPNDELTWRVSGNNDLLVDLVDGRVTLNYPYQSWRGRETLRFEVCDAAGACAFDEAQFVVLGESDVYVTHIGVSGFLIVTGDKKILIDSLFRDLSVGTESMNSFNFPSEIIVQLEKALSPFDDIDLVIATHSHPDHFEATITEQFLENSPNTKFISTQEVINILMANENLADRLVPIDLEYGESIAMTVNDIDLEAFFFPHNAINLGFILKLGETVVFHPGDMDVEFIDVSYIEELGIPDKEIDIAFAPIYSVNVSRNHREIFESFQAEYLILMHYRFPYADANYGFIDEYFPDAIKMRALMKSWLKP